MNEKEKTVTQDAQESLPFSSQKAEYKSPNVFETGNVQDLTQGSREQTSDEPGSGYKGG